MIWQDLVYTYHDFHSNFHNLTIFIIVSEGTCNNMMDFWNSHVNYSTRYGNSKSHTTAIYKNGQFSGCYDFLMKRNESREHQLCSGVVSKVQK